MCSGWKKRARAPERANYSFANTALCQHVCLHPPMISVSCYTLTHTHTQTHQVLMRSVNSLRFAILAPREKARPSHKVGSRAIWEDLCKTMNYDWLTHHSMALPHLGSQMISTTLHDSHGSCPKASRTTARTAESAARRPASPSTADRKTANRAP